LGFQLVAKLVQLHAALVSLLVQSHDDEVIEKVLGAFAVAEALQKQINHAVVGSPGLVQTGYDHSLAVDPAGPLLH